MATKAANGDGSVYRRKDGRWVAAITVEDAMGRKRRITRYVATKTDAREARRTLVQERARGQIVAPSQETVGDYLTRWLRDVVAINRRPNTIRAYRMQIETWIIPAIGHIRLDRLRAEDIEALQRDALAHVSPRTVTMIRAILATALKPAVARGIIARNVATLVEGPRVEPYEARALTAGEARRLIEAAADTRLEGVYRLALYLGMRQGEILGLRWQDVDWERGEITVRVQLVDAGPPPTLAEPKTRESHRTLPLVPAVARELHRQRGRQSADKLASMGQWIDRGLIFTLPSGEAVSAASLRGSFTRLVKRAGLPPMRFHDLRHACASLLAAEGVSARQSMAVLGHATLETNQLVYTHLLGGEITRAVERVVAAIASAETTNDETVAVSVAVNDR